MMMFAFGCHTASAQNNSLKIEDFETAPGQTRTLEILLDNESPISSLEFLVTLPEGLTYVDGSLAKVTSRVTRSSHSAHIFDKGEGMYNLFLLSTSSTVENSPVKGNSGAILTIDVQAAGDYKGGIIRITDIIGSDATVVMTDENGNPVLNDKGNPMYEPKRIDMAPCNVKAGVHVGDASADKSSMTARPGEAKEVGISLANVIDIVGLQAVVTLPEGVSLTEGRDGEYITYSDRLSGNVFADLAPLNKEENTYMLLISSLTSDVFEGDNGTLFALNVVADAACNGDIILSDIKVSSKYGVSYELDGPVSVAFQCVDDPTGDGAWDIDDIYAVIEASNSPGHNPACDLNGDGTTNIDDIYMVIEKTNE